MSLTTIDKNKLNLLRTELEIKTKNMLGYQMNKSFDYSDLYPFFKFAINNVGDPFEPSALKVNTLSFEREVLSFFAKLFRAPVDDWWGYVTHGGSEGNLYGLYLARECYPKAMVYYSTSSHYSVYKNLRLLNIPSIKIASEEKGEISYEDLERALEINRHRPAIIFANHGTTMTEAKDDISKIKLILNKLSITDYYIHVDAALSGMLSPFLPVKPKFDFDAGIDSISVSGHKFLGSPVPSGIIITRLQNRDKVATNIPYISSKDTTIAGSRNGISPLILWYAIKSFGMKGLQDQVGKCIDIAIYAEKELNRVGYKAWRNPGAITVVFPKPPKEIRIKWQLATHGEISHIVCMQDVDKTKIDNFIDDLTEINT